MTVMLRDGGKDNHANQTPLQLHRRAPRLLAGTLVVLLLMVTAATLVPGAAAAEIEGALSDDNIAAGVLDQILKDPVLKVKDVRITARDGVVTLRGSVPDLYQRRRMVRLAWATRGVKAVVDRLELLLAARDDGEIQKEVRHRLLVTPGLPVSGLKVAVNRGEVTISGEVASWQQGQRALTAARRVAGVRGVTDHLRLELNDRRTDTEILRDVKTQLRLDARVDPRGIQVSVKDGVVSLSGVVGSASEKARALVSGWVAGARQVDAKKLEVDRVLVDSLERQVYPRPGDRKLADWVRRALHMDPRVLAGTIEVQSDGGVVTLSGSTQTLDARRAAARDARNTVGVLRVRNLLKVRLEQAPSSDGLERTVGNLLRSDPVARRYELRFAVHEGELLLQGKLPNKLVRDHVLQLVWKVPGVQAVNDNLQLTRGATPVPDFKLLTDTKQALFWSAEVDDEQVKVSAKDGVVTLRGEVDSYLARKMAEDLAYRAGAWRVRNDLTLGSRR
jgi:osmotically-inducible protein OsmY